MKTCHECGSTKIVPEVRAIDKFREGDNIMQVAFFTKKKSWYSFREKNYSLVSARVCADCGYIAFFVKDPQKLWDAYQKALKDVS